MNKKDIRNHFRKSVFERDKYTCCVCGIKRDESLLDSHHIFDRSIMANGGYVKSNGITVCKDICHMKVEKFHISGGADWEPGLHPDDLYKMIGSSKYQADIDSENIVNKF